ncbi:MAG: methyltransferase domain-containing protein, partial [Desulforhabdus sp.]|nr:methyltransferase domain-containing protein [Desulforhabdus sp.]
EQLMSAIEGISSSKVDRSEFELAPRPQLEQEVSTLEQEVSTLEQEVSTLEQEVSTLKQVIQHLRRTVIEQDRKLWLFLQEAKKRLPDPFSEEQIERLLREEDHLLDALYVSFEDQFRGTRIDIKNRLRVYLPFIEEAGAGTAEAPVVDLGCGRGEWLEILQESNLHAVGVDRNRIMLQQCRELNLKVIENDAVQFLHGQNGNSLGAITGHHIIEHLDLTTLITLLDECFRTLKPGGILIFETPNPENLLVGAYSFHFDPTHKKVQVPDSLRFLVEQRGFSRTQILRLNRYSDLCQSDDDADDFRKKWFYSEMDFAIIAYKS